MSPTLYGYNNFYDKTSMIELDTINLNSCRCLKYETYSFYFRIFIK